MITYQVDSAVNDVLSCAEIIASKLPTGLPSTAVRLYTALVGAAIETMRRKGYSANVTHMVLHCPVEQVAAAINVSRQSVWRHLPALKALGVLDFRTHKAQARGLVRNTGTVFQVRLNPSSGRACRLSYDDLKHKWRPNFDREVRAGRTSYRVLTASSRQGLKHTEAQASQKVDIQRILDWSLSLTPTNHVTSSVCSKGKRVSLESLLDVRFSRKEDKNKAVDTAATALAQALSDSASINFYRRIIHGAYRALQRGLDLFQVLYQMVTRAAVDLRESFAKRAGALLISRLKDAGLYEVLLQT